MVHERSRTAQWVPAVCAVRMIWNRAAQREERDEGG